MAKDAVNGVTVPADSVMMEKLTAPRIGNLQITAPEPLRLWSHSRIISAMQSARRNAAWRFPIPIWRKKRAWTRMQYENCAADILMNWHCFASRRCLDLVRAP